jgi:hypothetical protein
MKNFTRPIILFALAGTLAGCHHDLLPLQYCYRCCAGIGSGALILKPGNAFEMDYEFPLKRKQAGKIYYGKGTYVQQKRKLFLTFNDLPSEKSEIVLTRIRDSDSLIVVVKAVCDTHHEPRGDSSVYGATVQYLPASPHQIVPVTNSTASVYGDPGQTVLRYRMNKPVIFQVSFIGYQTVQRRIDQPGVYEAHVKLAFGYADVAFRAGDKKTFMISRSDGELYIRDITNRKIFFSTQSCYGN